jgi:sulfoxide reductase heme-binding subunit YedZ
MARLNPRARRHLVLFGVALASVAVIFVALGFSPERWVDHAGLKADWPRWRLSMALAYTALGFLAVTLMLGPWQTIHRRLQPANFMLRRDVAYWAGGLALAHMAFGLFIHVDGLKFWWLFLTQRPSLENLLPLHYSWFGLANYTGLALGILVSVLLLISNNVALRRLGVQRWKALQRLSYGVLALVIVHALAYQSVEQRLWAMRLVVWAVLALTLGMQLAGFMAVRRKMAGPATHSKTYSTTDNL